MFGRLAPTRRMQAPLQKIHPKALSLISAQITSAGEDWKASSSTNQATVCQCVAHSWSELVCWVAFAPGKNNHAISYYSFAPAACNMMICL